MLAKELPKVIKYYAWEKPFMKKVEETRKEEVASHIIKIIFFFIAFVDASKYDLSLMSLWMLSLRLAVS